MAQYIPMHHGLTRPPQSHPSGSYQPREVHNVPAPLQPGHPGITHGIPRVSVPQPIPQGAIDYRFNPGMDYPNHTNTHTNTQHGLIQSSGMGPPMHSYNQPHFDSNSTRYHENHHRSAALNYDHMTSDHVQREMETVHLYGPKVIVYLHTPEAEAHIIGPSVAVHVHKDPYNVTRSHTAQGALQQPHVMLGPQMDSHETQCAVPNSNAMNRPHFQNMRQQDTPYGYNNPPQPWLQNSSFSPGNDGMIPLLDLDGTIRWLTKSECIRMQNKGAERSKSVDSSSSDDMNPSIEDGEVVSTTEPKPAEITLSDVGIPDNTSKELFTTFKHMEDVNKIRPNNVQIDEITEEQLLQERQRETDTLNGDADDDHVTMVDNDLYESEERDSAPPITATLQLSARDQETSGNSRPNVTSDEFTSPHIHVASHDSRIASHDQLSASHDPHVTSNKRGLRRTSRDTTSGDISDYALTEHDEYLTSSGDSVTKHHKSRISATASYQVQHQGGTHQQDLASHAHLSQTISAASTHLVSNEQSSISVSEESESETSDDTSGNSPQNETTKNAIFVIHAADVAMDTVESEIIKDNEYLSIEYMQEGLSVPGRNIHDYIMYHLRKATKLLVVVSDGLKACKWCMFAIQSALPHSKNIIPVSLEPCTPLVILSRLEIISADEKYFDTRMSKALMGPPVEKSDKQDATSEPYLLLAERPENPIKPHAMQRITVPFSPDTKNDHKVMFLIRYPDSCTESPQSKEFLSIRSSVESVYAISPDGETTPIKPEKYETHVRKWLITGNSKSLNELGFYMRFKNLPNGHRIIAYITFELTLTKNGSGDSKPRTLHSLQLDFETKEVSKREEAVKRRTSGAVGEDEDDEAPKEPLRPGLVSYSIKLNDDGTPMEGQSLPTKPTDGVVGYKRSSIKDGYADMEFDEFKRRVLEDEDEEDETAQDDGTKESAAQELNSRLDTLPLNAQEQYVFGEEDRNAMAEEADMLNSLQLRDKKEFWPKPGIFRKKKYHDMCYELEELGESVKDSKKADKFHQKAQEFYDGFKRKQRSDEQIMILLKQAGMEHYRRNMTEASEYVDKALDLVNKAQYRHQMKARIFYTISTIHRENRQFGKAKFWLDHAKELLKMAEPGEDTAKTYYNEGRLYMKMMSRKPRDSNDEMRDKECRKMAIRAFHFCLRDAPYDFKHYGMRLEVSLIRRCYLHMAHLFVDSPEEPYARARNIVTIEDLLMAKLCLRSLKMPEYMPDNIQQNIRFRAHLHLVESGFCFRKAQLCSHMSEKKFKVKAKKNLTNAIRHAKTVTDMPDNIQENKIGKQFLDYLRGINLECI